ncbi:MAG: creatininase family protein [candidate division KSB1 bacterium]|nr:creatininase family protein [candidate division KSB1 bacterium]MDZ7368978.1 creatininase family protein [candidate division KSB1 bacterium]MDZ7406984.1 creatininase family protein [candidate division KSB1 bacterium]
MKLSRPLFFFIVFSSFCAFAQPPGAFLGELSWPEAEARLKIAPLVILPFGAGAKEHGPHLPMNADAKVMEYLCQQAVKSLPVIVAPPILHGWFPAFREFPGTEVAKAEVFQSYVYEVAMSLIRHGAKRIVLLNTGISRATGLPLSIVAREIRVQTGTPVLVISWDDLETPAIDSLQEQKAGGHADEIETSINLFLQPELVRMEKAVVDYGTSGRKKYPGYEPGLFSRNPRDPEFSQTGLFGDPTKATAEKGGKALEILTRQWLRALEGFSKAPLRSDETKNR